MIAVEHPDFPGERLIACKNEDLARLRAHKRESLLGATEGELAKIRVRVSLGRLVGKAKIGITVGRVVNKYKVAKHFQLTIEDTAFCFVRDEVAIVNEASLDGIYIIRTSVPKKGSS